ncbi:toxin ParE1/3/4 [Devosia sp. UYZn731]|uniref:type II toxin-antitoxin system RelE/ParE family toxin n=1 Tax=Devosia sp. UYZn731 TaxID=3156345 RepID=UPI00339A21C8
MPDYRLSASALLDLGDIFAFSAQQYGRSQAEKYFASMRATFHRLALNPNIGSAASGVTPTLRRHSVGTHVVFYRPTSTGIFIVRVIHTARLTGNLPDDLA